jgi:hypothetical protein
MLKKIHIAVLACVFFIPVVAIGLYFFGPRSETTFACSMCGRQNVKKKYIGLTYYTKELETDDSRWYQAKGLKPHHHDWQYVCSDEQDWGGGGVHIDGFGLFLFPLHLLRETEKQVNVTQFEELIEEYYTTHKDKTKIKDFVRHCEEILGPNNPFRSDSLKVEVQHDQ